MIRILLFTSILFFLSITIGVAQNNFHAVVKDKNTNGPLPGVSVTVKGKAVGKTTDAAGYIQITNLTPGSYNLEFSSVAYSATSLTIQIPDTALHVILMEAESKTLENVTVISSTRNNTSIENSPLKVEVLGKEEMDEENTIKPGNIASILGDISGIQIQQSSAVSGNANVRIQGLEGRYTQILRDGMPLYEGFSGGFGVLSIAPLDLRQIELIKGSASTLYGGGAIGGLINLISKRPTTKQEGIFTVNQSSLKESNINTYIAKRKGQFGYNVFAGITKQGAADVNKDGFTDVAQLDAVIVHPKLFFYPSSNTTIAAGYTGTFETRVGGDVLAVKGPKTAQHPFFEKNITDRNTFEFSAEHTYGNRSKATLKASTSNFNRTINTNTYNVAGGQFNYFTEASLYLPKENSDWVLGVNVTGDNFKKKSGDSIPLTNFDNNTVGGFGQYSFKLKTNTTVESGLRLDVHNTYGAFVLPRIALFHRFNEEWAGRAGFGVGYKTPNALSQQSVEYSITEIQPIDANVKAETSYGFNAEVNYKKEFGEDNSFFINQAFFLTQLNSPIVVNDFGGNVSFSNAAKPIISKGFDTYTQVELSGWEIYLGYTFTIAERKYLNSNQFVPLTPKHRAATTIVKEIEDKWRFGIEASYTGPQYRDYNFKTRGYLFAAAMVERKFGKHVSLVLNGENLLDFRQSKYEALYVGSITNPAFKPLWAPIDGRIINMSLKLQL